MRILLAMLIAVLLTSAAEAQRTRNKQRADSTVQSEAQKKKQRDADKAYKSSLEKMPDKKYDPWAKVR
jgi:hypothetical protein